MRLPSVATLVLMATACAPNDAPPLDTTSPPDDDSGSLTEACVEYLACAALAIPEHAAAIEARLGEGGTCWTSGYETPAECRRECLDGLESLREVYSPDCSGADTGGGDPGSDTGDTGRSPIPDAANCPLGTDRWEMEFAFEVDTCG